MPNTVPSCGNTSTPVTHRDPSDLAVAARVGQHMLDTYGHAGHDDLFALNQAYGAVREALRLMLRAVGAETNGRGEG